MMSANIGDLRVWHIWQFTGTPQQSLCIPIQSTDEPAQSTTEALAIINARADSQVNDESVEWNAFGLEIYEADDGTGNPGWCEWYNEDGDSIEDIEQEAE